MGLKDYAKAFSVLGKEKWGRKVLLAEINKRIYLTAYQRRVQQWDKEKALKETVNWFLYNQSCMENDGLGTYKIAHGWTSSYPETTGYIIPSLLRYFSLTRDAKVEEAARKALDWLLEIQHPVGGWQGGYLAQDRPPVVFNTGQIIRGMNAGYAHFKDERYLKAAQKAGDWLKEIQHPDGYFHQYVYMNEIRVYETYAVSPLLETDRLAGTNNYSEVVSKMVDWVVKKKQKENGWFPDADNTTHKNHKPILHTISYTIEGILDAGLALEREDWIQAAKKPADEILTQFEKKGILPGRFDENWSGSEDFLTTGGAQIALIWQKLGEQFQDQRYFEGVSKMNTLLTSIHQRNVFEPKEIKGAIFGSFPFWGRYESFSCPNWASKYLADTLMNELNPLD